MTPRARRIGTAAALGTALLALTLALPSPPGEAEATPDRARLIKRGEALVASHQCNRCHDGIGKPALVDKHCVRCHQQIHDGRFAASPEALKKWQANIVHLRAVPSLAGAGKRLDPDWFAAFLQEPHDLRPRLGATMPRLGLSKAESRAIAAFLTRDAPAKAAAPPNGDAAAGRASMAELGCTTCHAFTGVSPPIPPGALPVTLPPAQLARALWLAPDLRHTRDRFRPGALVPWLLDPSALNPDTAMPRVPMTRKQATNIATFLLTADLEPAPAAHAVPKRLPPLKRPVTWDEVESKVFKKVCWHCHSDPSYADGDGGPGNTGGFGFEGRGVSFATYREVLSGRLDDAGKRQSLFKPGPTGDPRLVEVLWARHREAAGKPVEGVRGMPLGLPPLSAEQIQLVETWIKQGRPR